MEKLRKTIEQYGRWQDLSMYVERMETALLTDFSLALENAKALLESIGKHIYKMQTNEDLGDEDIQQVLKKAFTALGYGNQELVNQVSRSLANIAKEMGSLRNEIGSTSHGRTLDELRVRNDKVDVC